MVQRYLKKAMADAKRNANKSQPQRTLTALPSTDLRRSAGGGGSLHPADPNATAENIDWSSLDVNMDQLVGKDQTYYNSNLLAIELKNIGFDPNNRFGTTTYSGGTTQTNVSNSDQYKQLLDDFYALTPDQQYELVAKPMQAKNVKGYTTDQLNTATTTAIDEAKRGYEGGGSLNLPSSSYVLEQLDKSGGDQGAFSQGQADTADWRIERADEWQKEHENRKFPNAFKMLGGNNVGDKLKNAGNATNDMTLENFAKDPFGTVTEPIEATGEMIDGSALDETTAGQLTADVLKNPQNAAVAAATVSALAPYAPGGGGGGGAAGSTATGAAGGAGMDWGTAAVIGGSSLASALIGAEAADDAADASRKATEATVGEAGRQFDLTREDTATQREYGDKAIVALASELGLNGEQPLEGEVMPAAPELTPFEFKLEADPGYNFIKNEAVGAVDAAMRARGGGNSGRRLVEIADRISGLAATHANDSFNRQYATNNTNTSRLLTKYGLDLDQSNLNYGKKQDRLNRLATVARIGQTATGTSANMGANTANIINSANQGNAARIGNAGMAEADAWSNGISNVANAYLYNNNKSSLYDIYNRQVNG